MVNEIDENTWVISDTHFDHAKILSYERERVTSMLNQGIDDHNEWLLYNWNSVVGVNDLVLHLGDLAFKNPCEWLAKLNGRIIMVLGNHDVASRHELQNYAQQNLNRFFLVEGINGAVDIENPWLSAFTKDINGQRVLFSHYPVLSIDPYVKDQVKDTIKLLKQSFISEGCHLNIHGHLHSKDSRSDPREINVSLERIGFKPVKILSVMNNVSLVGYVEAPVD